MTRDDLAAVLRQQWPQRDDLIDHILRLLHERHARTELRLMMREAGLATDEIAKIRARQADENQRIVREHVDALLAPPTERPH